MNAKIISLLLAASFVVSGCTSQNQRSASSDLSPVASSTGKSAYEISAEEHKALKTAAKEANAAKVAAAKEAAIKAEQDAIARAQEEKRIAAELVVQEETARKAQEAALAEQQAQEKAKADAEALKKTQEVAVPAQNSTAVLPGETGYQWMDRMQRLYGVYAYPGTQFFIAQSTPCAHFAPQALGCTEQLLDSVTHEPWHKGIKLHMAEAAIGNLYVLFHEIGHTQGIMDECQADIYSRNVTGIPGGFYCQ